MFECSNVLKHDSFPFCPAGFSFLLPAGFFYPRTAGTETETGECGGMGRGEVRIYQ